VVSASKDLVHVTEPEKPVEEKPSISSLLRNDNIKQQLLSFLISRTSQELLSPYDKTVSESINGTQASHKPSIPTFVLAMQNKALQKLVLDTYAPLKLSDFGIDHGLNRITETFYQKPQIIGPEE
jgi:hypothetical protein